MIPARGGSRRIPAKNLAPLAGLPLIAHTIHAATAARTVERVYVSTDSPEIAGVSRRHGARVLWRPAPLCDDRAPTEPALIHAVEQIEAASGQPVGVVVMLQATSPLRGAKRIDEAVHLLRDRGCDSVVSVVPDVGYYFLGDVDACGRLRVGYDPRERLRTQEIPPRYRENGAIYAMTRAQLMERGCRMGGDMRALVMDECESVDIDTPRDLLLCRALLEDRAGAPAAPLQADATPVAAPAS